MSLLKTVDGHSRLVGIGFLLRVSRAALQFITYGLLVRLLSVQQFGAYAFLAAVIQVVCVPAQFGLPQLVLRDAARLVLAGDTGGLTALAGWARRVFLITSGLGVALAILALYVKAPPTVEWFDACLALVMVPVIGMINLDSSQLRGMGYGARSQIAELFVAPALFLLCVVVLFTARDLLQANVTAVLAVRFAAFLAAIVVANRLLQCHRGLPRGPALAPVATERCRRRRFAAVESQPGVRCQRGSVCAEYERSILAIAYISGEAEDALCKVAAIVGGAVGLLLQSLNAALGPVISRELALGNPARLEGLIYRQLRLLSTAVVALFLLLVVLGEPLMARAFGASYAEPLPSCRWPSPAVYQRPLAPWACCSHGGHEAKLRASLVS
ncbi:MAG: hypothetical protein R3E54_06200 [Halioglobus sp.]